jgi:hypothetical protein
MVGNRAPAIANRARYSTAAMGLSDFQAFLFQRKRAVGHFPGSVQTEQ